MRAGMRIGSTVRRLREALDLTMEELAERAEVTPQTVWLIEQDRSFPRRTTLQKLASALGVDPEDLLRPPAPSSNPPGLQAMLDQGLADPPPTEEELEELREVPFRGEPDAVSYLYALQAIRRANVRKDRKNGGGDPSSGGVE